MQAALSQTQSLLLWERGHWPLPNSSGARACEDLTPSLGRWHQSSGARISPASSGDLGSASGLGCRLRPESSSVAAWATAISATASAPACHPGADIASMLCTSHGTASYACLLLLLLLLGPCVLLQRLPGLWLGLGGGFRRAPGLGGSAGRRLKVHTPI